MLPTWIWEAYGWSQEIYLEANTDDLKADTRAAAGTIAQQNLPPDILASLKAAWPAAHPFGALKSQKLWAVAVGLVTLGLRVVPGVEIQITQRAITDSRSIKYLETMGEFAALLDAVSDSVVVEAITRLQADPEKRMKDIVDMYTAWMSGRVEDVGALMRRAALGRFPQVREIVFDRRNLNWLPRITATLSSPKPTLILVGAGHLAGESGLLALLKRAGHEVSPVAY
jgi:hypothetical protein